MKYREAFEICVPQEKRRNARTDYFAYYVGRPLSVLMTLPFINTRIKPTTVTIWSIIASIIGAILVSLNIGLTYSIIGWLFFFLWNLLDGVDGNLARCTGQCSKQGELWDAFGGYLALVLMFFSSGIAAFYDNNAIYILEPYYYLIIGGATSVLAIFPRLLAQKKKAICGNESVSGVMDKGNFGFVQIVARNIESAAGFLQVLLLFAIIFRMMNIFIILYFFVNVAMTIVGLRAVLRK